MKKDSTNHDSPSPQLSASVRIDFPLPIAQAFHSFEKESNWKASLTQLCELAGICIQTISLFLFSQYLCNTENNIENNTRMENLLRKELSKPVSYGTWLGLSLRFVREIKGRKTQGIKKLIDSFGEDGKQDNMGTLYGLFSKIVVLRNQLLKKSAGMAPQKKERDELLRLLVSAFNQLRFLDEWYIVGTQTSRTDGNIRRHDVRIFAGSDMSGRPDYMSCG